MKIFVIDIIKFILRHMNLKMREGGSAMKWRNPTLIYPVTGCLTDNKESTTRTLTIGEKNGHMRDLEIFENRSGSQ